jgi:hypothetical protein
MAENRRDTQQPSGLKQGDIFFALFKFKKTIIVWATLGILATAAVWDIGNRS